MTDQERELLATIERAEMLIANLPDWPIGLTVLDRKIGSDEPAQEGAMITTPPRDEVLRRIKEKDIRFTSRRIALLEASHYITHDQCVAFATLFVEATAMLPKLAAYVRQTLTPPGDLTADDELIRGLLMFLDDDNPENSCKQDFRRAVSRLTAERDRLMNFVNAFLLHFCDLDEMLSGRESQAATELIAEARRLSPVRETTDTPQPEMRERIEAAVASQLDLRFPYATHAELTKNITDAVVDVLTILGVQT